MASRHFYYAAAVMILAMLIGGGTLQSLWTDDLLQIALLPALWMGLGRLGSTRLSQWGRALALAIVALCLLQFVPVLREISVPAEMGGGRRWGVWSLAPQQALESALFAISVTGFWLYVSRFSDEDQSRLYRAFMVGLIVNLAAAAIQYSFPGNVHIEGVLAYVIRAGMFANENHLATLTFLAIPLIAWRYIERAYNPLVAVGIIALLLFFLFAIRSRAGMAAGPLVAGISLFWFLGMRERPYAKLLAALATLGAAVLLMVRFGGETVPADLRWKIFVNTWKAAFEYLPFGAGLGSFTSVYPAFEPADQVASYYINRAHNEYLEFFLETGLPGLAILVLGVWVLLQGFARSRFAQAAFLSILCVAVHSVVEYPLRTMAIMVPLSWLFAVATSLIPDPTVRRRVRVEREPVRLSEQDVETLLEEELRGPSGGSVLLPPQTR